MASLTGSAGPKATPVTTDLSGAQQWQLRPDLPYLAYDTSTVPGQTLTTDVVFFGIPFTVDRQKLNGGDYTSAEYLPADFARFTRVIGFSARTEACSGSVVLVFPGSNGLTTVAGGAAVAVSFLSILLLTFMLFRRRRVGGSGRYPVWRLTTAALSGLILGFLAGSSEGLFLQEIGTASPFDSRLLLLPAVGAAVGLLVGLLGGQRAKAVAASGPSMASYEILGSIGRGATGEVYLGREVGTQQRVAVKVLTAELAANTAFRERFRSEAEVLKRLDHPNCVRFLGLMESVEQPVLIMEYVDGASLQAVLDEAGRLTPEQALGVLQGALRGLEHAHGLGLVHGDVKPQNIIVDREGVSKLIDFGLSRRGENTVLSGEPVQGTPSYMSPEQVSGSGVDQRSDIYAAGVILYQLVLGRLPFVAPTVAEVLKAQVEEAPPDPATIDPAIHPMVAQLLKTALAKDPRDRPASASEFLQRLEAAANAGYGPNWERRASIATIAGAAAAVAGVSGAAAAAGGAGLPAALAAFSAPAAVGQASVGSAVISVAAVVPAASASGAAAIAAAPAAAPAAAALAAKSAVGHVGLLAKVPTIGQVGISLVITAVVTAALPRLPLVPPPSSDVITPAQAKVLFESTWGTVANRSPSNLIVGESLTEIRGLSSTASEKATLQLRDARVFVKHQSTYPAQFLGFGYVDETDPSKPDSYASEGLLTIFARHSVSEPWQMSYVALSGGSLQPKLLVSADGFVPELSSNKLLVDPSTLSAAYARYLEAISHDQPAPASPPLVDLYLASAIKSDFQATYQHNLANHVPVNSYHFAPAPDLEVYPVSGGSAMVMFNVAASFLGSNGQGGCTLANGYLSFETPHGIIPNGQFSTGNIHLVMSAMAIDPAAGATGPPLTATPAAGSPATVPVSPLGSGSITVVNGGQQIVAVDTVPC
jgi:tRNA A-37 threonylcarbamoyl transferase component Bud32